MEFKDFVEKKHWYTSFWADLAYIIIGVLVLLFIFGTQYATGQLGYSASLEKNVIRSDDSIIVNFSQPVVASVVEKNFQITPAAKVNFSWSNNYQKVEIRPADELEKGKNYTILVDPQADFSVSKILGKAMEPKKLSVQVESLPKIISVSPASGESNVKIDSVIKISFDKSTTGYDVNFIVEPFSNFDLSYDNSRKDFTIFPKGKLDYARDYAISVKIFPSAKNASIGAMEEVFRANFKTEISPPPPPKVEEVVLPEKNSPIVPDSQVATPDAKIKDGKYIDINLAKQQLSIFENGERLGTYKVSTGKRGMATPKGTFKVMAKRGRAWSKKYKLYMPYFMQFTGVGHGVHELPEWKNGYKEGAAHLGTPVSHGCVRLGVGPAAKVYNWSDIGTPIIIHY